MSAKEKESIFVELRQYHLEEFPEVFSSPRMTALHDEYALIEDDAITMLLSLVNGKAEYVDYLENVKGFLVKVKALDSTDQAEKAEQKLFAQKAQLLNNILTLASKGDFPLRKQKVPRISLSRKTVTVKSNN